MILIVDDSEGLSKMSNTVGEKYGMKRASSAVIAVNIVTNEKIDLIVINLDMHEASGLSILKKIKSFQSQKDKPVIALTNDMKSIIAEEATILPNVKLVDASTEDSELIAEIDKYGIEAFEDWDDDKDYDSGRKVILVVDDDVVALETLSFYLEDKYEVQMADSGRDALDKMATRIPDAILLDVRMPGMDGITFFKKIKSEPKYKNIPVIFQTGASDIETVRECISIGPMGFIVKPVRKRILMEKIEEALVEEKRQQHILIIEPDMISCNIMKHHLHKNFKVSVESSVQFALSLLSSQVPDLIIMDDESPCSSFYKIRAKQSDIPVILLSETCTDYEGLDKCIAIGAIGVIKNIYDRVEIMEMVNKALGK